MAKILFVKSGEHENPVTKTSEADVKITKMLIGTRKTKFIGSTLEPIGEKSRMSDYAGPDHVVLELSESEAVELELVNGSGLYVVDGLSPAEVEL